MKVTDFTKKALDERRLGKQLMEAGYWHLEDPVWEINRGFLYRERITDVKISPDGKTLYVKISNAPKDR